MQNEHIQHIEGPMRQRSIVLSSKELMCAIDAMFDYASTPTISFSALAPITCEMLLARGELKRPILQVKTAQIQD